MSSTLEIRTFPDGSKIWEENFGAFTAKVYLPVTKQPADVVNFGFRAPYLMIFEEKKSAQEEAKAFADESGLAAVASEFAGSVVFFYPTSEGGWESAPDDLFAQIIANSRISQYYKDGTAIMYDRFAKKMGEKLYIRGAVLRTYLYGFGVSADYIAKNCLKTIEGDGLYGKGDITPAGCVLQRLSVIPKPERRDIPVMSVANTPEVNQALSAGLDHVLIKESVAYREDFEAFTGTFRRMVGNLEKEADLNKMGMAMEPGVITVKTSADNRGDDRDTAEHEIGYVAYYNKGIMDGGKTVPLLLCFHGGGDSAMCMASLSGWYQVAAKYGFLLVSIENHLNSTATEMMELLGELKKRYSIDSEKIYASGFSMGGCKSWDMFQEYPRVFAAVAPMDATYDVGLNSYGEKAPALNQDTIVPVFYAGGEITPLPELPFQEAKCFNRMKYVLTVNQANEQYDLTYEGKESWPDPIFGVSGDAVYKIPNPEREGSVLTLHLYDSGNVCYCVFGCVGQQGHEVRHHTCENAWKFMNLFRRLPDGTIEGGSKEEVRRIYEEV